MAGLLFVQAMPIPVVKPMFQRQLKELVLLLFPPEGGEKEKDKFFELPLEHRYDNRDRHCLEE